MQSKTGTLRKLLAPTEEEARWYREVMALDSASVTPTLTDILADPRETPLTRKMAVTILGLIADPRAVEPLRQALQAADPVLRAQAAKALGRLGGPETGAVEALVHGLSDEVYFVRAACAGALGRIGLSEAVPRLEEMSAADPVAANREVARKAIEGIQGPETNRGRGSS